MPKWLWRMTNSAPDRVLINDPKKLFRKKLYVTIPQWSETFPSMSDIWSDHNSAKFGLQLNDPIDWFKLRLNQPKMLQVYIFSTHFLTHILDITMCLHGKMTHFVKGVYKVLHIMTYLNCWRCCGLTDCCWATGGCCLGADSCRRWLPTTVCIGCPAGSWKNIL